MEGADQYADFAERYDLFQGRSDASRPEARAFFQKIFTECHVSRALDCACGTGRDLLLLHSLGCQVVGADLSASMLSQARKSLVAQGLSVPLVQADYRSLPAVFPGPFDAVVCLSTSIAEMPNDHEALRAFKSMYGVLRHSGVLILDQGTTDRQWLEKPRFIVATDAPEITRLFVIDYAGGRSATYHVVDVDHQSDPGHKLRVWSIRLHVLLRDDQERLLKRVGFTSVEFFGDYTETPYDKETSSRLITVAKR